MVMIPSGASEAGGDGDDFEAAGTPAGAKQAAPAPSAEAPDGIITTDKDSILS